MSWRDLSFEQKQFIVDYLFSPGSSHKGLLEEDEDGLLEEFYDEGIGDPVEQLYTAVCEMFL